MQLLIFLLHLIILLIGAVSPAAAKFDIWAHDCNPSYGNYTANSTFKSNLDALLTNFTTLDIPYGFYNSSTGEDPDKVEAIALCREDVNVTECHSCISFLKSNLTGSCPTDMRVIGWADKCMLRYATPTILDGRWASSPKEYIYTGVDAGGNATEVDHFANVVEELLMSLPKNAAAGDYRKKFAYGEASVNASQKVYGFMQCTPELKASDCLGCLYLGMYYIYKNRGQTGAKILQPSCSIRYELYKFYVGSPSGSGKKSVNLTTVSTVLAVVLVAILFLFVIFLIWLLPRQREENKMKKKRNHFKSLEMDSGFIKDATRNFSQANVLGSGRGGISTVYKGKLHGKEIAVKRIKGTRYLTNDELLSAKLQHTNLVELLGVCLLGNEKLLIFEYVSRGSLDQILFDPKHEEERAQMDWEKRYVIIQGIAQGLLYLHKEYRDIVVHCDLNAANVFLDKHWRPKITDFGTAMLNPSENDDEDETRLVSPKVGDTVAYMAPEYLKRGKISVKLDVYSFGILVLEILACRRTKIPNQEDLISLAWRKWFNGTVLEIIDQKIKPTTDSAGMKMTRCIHIALLCLQESATERPEMSSVVEMLSGQSSNIIAQPSLPASMKNSIPHPSLPNRFP